MTKFDFKCDCGTWIRGDAPKAHVEHVAKVCKADHHWVGCNWALVVDGKRETSKPKPPSLRCADAVEK